MTLSSRVIVIQILSILGAIYVTSKEGVQGTDLAVGYISFILLLILLFAQTYVNRLKRNVTMQHFDAIMNQIEVHDTNITKELLRKIGKELIDEDFVEDSFGNEISGRYRERKRKILSEFINAVTKNKNITEEDLLLTDRKRHFARITYSILGVLSIMLFIGIYVWLIFVVLP